MSLPKQNIFITVIRRLGVGWTRVSHTMNVETRRQLAKVDAPSTMYVLGIELRSRAWRQARLPAEPPCWPTEYFYSYLTNFFFLNPSPDLLNLVPFQFWSTLDVLESCGIKTSAFPRLTCWEHVATGGSADSKWRQLGVEYSTVYSGASNFLTIANSRNSVGEEKFKLGPLQALQTGSSSSRLLNKLIHWCRFTQHQGLHCGYR